MAMSREAKEELARSWPNLRALLNLEGLESFWEALDGGILDQAEINEAFWASDWFINHADAARVWITLQETDPATAQRDLDSMVGRLEREAGRAGIAVTAEQLNEIADQSIRWGLSDADITAMLGAYVTDDATTTGSIADMARDLQIEARGFFTELSDKQALDYARRIFTNNLTYDGVVNQFRGDAASFYPQFSDAFDRGLNVAQATNGLRTHLAGMLDVTAEQIDFTDPRFSHLIDFADPETGETRVKTKTEIDQWARSQTEYRASAQGMAQGSGLTSTFLKVFGKVA